MLKNNSNNLKNFLINENIISSEVRLISKDGKQLGIISLKKAFQIALLENLDLVQLDTVVNPPTVKLMDYKKFLFNRNKNLSHFKFKKIKVKEVKFRVSTCKHDFDLKIRNIINFLEKKNKVKVSIVFRGREILYKELGSKVLVGIKNAVLDVGVVKDEPKLEGRQLVILIEPN